MDCEPYSKWEIRNQVKKSLMSTKQGEDTVAQQRNTLEDTILSRELYQIIDGNIPIPMREDWIRFVNKLKLPKAKREALLEHIKEILRNNGIES